LSGDVPPVRTRAFPVNPLLLPDERFVSLDARLVGGMQGCFGASLAIPSAVNR